MAAERKKNMTMDEFMLVVEKYEAKGPIENTLRHFGYPEDIKTTLYRQWDKSEYDFQRTYILPVPEIRPCTEGSRGGIVGYQISRRAG